MESEWGDTARQIEVYNTRTDPSRPVVLVEFDPIHPGHRYHYSATDRGGARGETCPSTAGYYRTGVLARDVDDRRDFVSCLRENHAIGLASHQRRILRIQMAFERVRKHPLVAQSLSKFADNRHPLNGTGSPEEGLTVSESGQSPSSAAGCQHSKPIPRLHFDRRLAGQSDSLT
jgi:hypothetical protein